MAARPTCLFIMLAAYSSLLLGCLGVESGRCSWGMVCPSGRECHEPTLSCVETELIVACVGLDDTDPCVFPGSGESSFCRNGVCTAPICGDGEINSPEECESADLNGMTCESFRFNGGILTCSDTTCQFDTTSCVGGCGDGVLNGTVEECDGNDLGDSNCQELGYYVGTLSCSEDCELIDTACERWCGDSIINGTETCDGTEFGQTTCVELGLYGGELTCRDDCTIDSSGCFTTQLIEFCVLDDQVANPIPFVDCSLSSPPNPIATLDYGVVSFGVPTSRLVAIRNQDPGHARVDDAIVTAVEPAILAEFTLRFFKYDTDGVTEIDVTPPVHLDGADPNDVLYVEVTFSANIDGLVSDTALSIVAPSDPNLHLVPITAAISGCPQNMWDINNDPSDGCEYPCIYSGLEQCNTGLDENCDGAPNDEGAVGCTIYFKDGDNDTFGIDGDWRCLCAPDLVSDYTATLDGDCDDNNNLINPGATEVCDGVDNDCVPATTEDFGSTTCGLGVCNHTIDNCVSGVPQTCDPFEGAAASDTCANNLDDDCDGDTDCGDIECDGMACNGGTCISGTCQ